MIKWVKQHKVHLGMYLLFSAVIIWLLSYRPDNTQGKLDELQEEIELREDSILVLNTRIVELYQDVEIHQEKRDSSEVVIQSLESYIKQKNNEYENSIRAIDTLNISQLQEYFTSRYTR